MLNMDRFSAPTLQEDMERFGPVLKTQGERLELTEALSQLSLDIDAALFEYRAKVPSAREIETMMADTPSGASPGTSAAIRNEDEIYAELTRLRREADALSRLFQKGAKR